MNSFEKLYKDLRKKYGKPEDQWSLWCKRPKKNREREEVIIGALLTQRTNWNNVELALYNMRAAKKLSLGAIARCRPEKLAQLVKPAGFYLTKAHYLSGLARFIVRKYGSIENMKQRSCFLLREELLDQKGIGPETADSILLYALDKPVFVIDEYTRRLVRKCRLAENLSYDSLQEMFEVNLKKDFRLYQDFHALIVIGGKNRAWS